MPTQLFSSSKCARYVGLVRVRVRVRVLIYFLLVVFHSNLLVIWCSPLPPTCCRLPLESACHSQSKAITNDGGAATITTVGCAKENTITTYPLGCNGPDGPHDTLPMNKVRCASAYADIYIYICVYILPVVVVVDGDGG